ncbi:MAG: hypothetical protein OEZ01_01055, partial [Candidatus Heimdallarchaeota archaeon]|nr:hypothetical protein [Candidatus Heimdallarchaeota archaeon]
MFTKFISNIENSENKRMQYARDLISYLNKNMSSQQLYSVHGHCTDGGVAGSMIRYAIEGAVIIPLDYWMINHPDLKEELAGLNWKGIVDLAPFNKGEIDFWVDHHVSAMSYYPNAKKIRFDINGDSGSYQLLLSDFLGNLPHHIVEIATMTRITDTAGYSTEPPVNRIKQLSDLDFNENDSINKKYQQEQRIWLLDDAWGSTVTLKEHLDMYNYLAKEGFYGLSRVLNKVNTLRDSRQDAVSLANSLDINADIIIFSYHEEKQDRFTITRRLQSRGAKVVCSLQISINNGIRISLRRNRNISIKDKELIKLNILASQMNGG